MKSKTWDTVGWPSLLALFAARPDVSADVLRVYFDGPRWRCSRKLFHQLHRLTGHSVYVCFIRAKKKSLRMFHDICAKQKVYVCSMTSELRSICPKYNSKYSTSFIRES